MAKKRRGMIIKNTDDKAVEVKMKSRLLHVGPGEEKAITAEEVRDPALRESLQVRAISIVRPVTEDEEQALRSALEQGDEPAV